MLFLIGLPACGKSTLMRALAAAVPGLRTIDLDDAIESLAGTTIPEIFATEGESAFRHRETATLLSLANDGYDIIACGGGTPCQAGNMEFMLSKGKVIFLHADTSVIVHRLLDAPNKRPMAEPFQGNPEAMTQFVEDLKARRLPHYTRASHTFDTTKLDTPEQINATVENFIKQFIAINP